MLNAFQDHINQRLSFLKESKLLIAISGGLDSVVLTHLCHALNLDIALAHCNFKLRAEESDADEAFVLQLAEDLNVELFIEHFDTEAYALYHKVSIQMAARELRYDWFYKLADHLDFDYILTAHHADDNLETFLINLSRGTGLEGLIGIPEVNKSVVRPLLPFSRHTLVDYAKETNINWREDSSNASTKYLRNALRHDVIPKLKELNPQFLDNFKTTQKYLNESASIVDDRIDDIADSIINVTPKGLYFSIQNIKELNQPKAYLHKMLQVYGFTQWDDIHNLLSAQSGKFVVSNSWRLLKDRDTLILSELPNDHQEIIIISDTIKEIDTPLGTLNFSETSEISERKPQVVFLDKSKLTFPLTLRQWREGDLFYPFGMTGSKKLSKYFKDEKLSLLDKENIWLLCSEEAIVWIVGMREDKRYSATETTSHILKIELH